jgi:prepilin-type N-terminal cleavage/methylation domain-containing protein
MLLFHKHSKKAYSLIEVLIAVALVGIIILALGSVLQNFISAKKKVELANNIESIRNEIRQKQDCANIVFPSAPCPAKTKIKIKNKFNKNIEVVAGYRLRGVCTGKNKEFNIFYNKPRSKTKKKKKRKKEKWTNLFEIPRSCK